MAIAVYTNARLCKIPFFTLFDFLLTWPCFGFFQTWHPPILKQPSRLKMWWRWDGGLLSVVGLSMCEEAVS